MIDKDTFKKYVKNGYSVIPLKYDFKLENETPLSLYKKMESGNSFLLESVEGGINFAQYSVIGFNCRETISLYRDTICINRDGKKQEINSSRQLDDLFKILTKDKCPVLKDMPRFFGGYVGFFAYESSKYAEKKIFNLEKKPSKFSENMPDVFLVKAKELIVFDNFNNQISVILNVYPEEESYEDAVKGIESLKEKISSQINFSLKEFATPKKELKYKSNFRKEEFLNAVKKVKEYIKEGDVMQTVLAQDFSLNFDGDSFELYCALRELNPSPYMYYLNFSNCQVVGASPEILVRVEDENITLRPIAGTRRRGENEEEDKANEIDLLNDVKEIAEHLMLIDLGRNDLGRVSEIGTVKVTEKMIVEKYSHVMHIVSNVEGKLCKDHQSIDALKSSLPAGTLSGAPKIRAMEIINELEPSSRGIYGGAIGYVSWNGNIDTAIAIRTAVIKDKNMHVGAGAGIVADSIPENEWEECNQKASVFLDAVEMIS